MHINKKSIFFYILQAKKDGSMRFILNLTRLNKYILTLHFKMENILTATKAIATKLFMTNIDLQYASIHITVRKNT